MHAIFAAISSRLDLVFFVYGFSFTAMGLLLFVQPKRDNSFAIAENLPLLGWFGLTHGFNEFMDMWALLNPGTSPRFELTKTAVLVTSFVLLLEFGRRALLNLAREQQAGGPIPMRLLGPGLTAVLACVTLLAAGLSPAPVSGAAAFSRPLLCFTGSLMSALAFLGYYKFRAKTLSRLKAGNFFIAVGAAFLLYAVLGGLVLPDSALPLPYWLNYSLFNSVIGLPVQIFRALCAVTIFISIVGVVRIFREGALQTAQQELLDIIEFFPDATFVVDGDRKVIAWNRALEHMTGVHKSRMLGKGDFEYSIPFYGVRRPILIDLIGKPTPEAEKLYKYVTKRGDGAIYAEVFVPSLYGGRGAHVWVTASPLKDKEGNVYGAIESVRDVTDKKLAEAALHRSEAQYRALIETTNTGFLIIDEKGLVLDANREYARMTGHRTLDELRGRSVMEWTAPYERDKNAKAVARCAVLGYIRNFEIDYVTPENAIVPVELNATVVEIDGKQRILTLCRDITDRRIAEKLLKDSENKFRSLTEKSLVGVYMVQSGVFKYVNPKLAEIFGYAAEELIDRKGPQDLVTPEDWPTVGENLRKRLEGDISDINYSFLGLRKDGTVIDVEVFGSKSEFNGRPAVLGTLLDITARKEAERVLLDSKAVLEKRVQERTAQLAELNKELEAFSYSAAHDLKAPLRRVNIFAEMLESEAGKELKSSQREHLKTIRKSVAQMNGLVEGLLNLSTTGRRPLDMAPVKLSELLRETSEEVTPDGGKAVAWTLAELPEVNCDRAMLKQVLSNLISNAVKYSRGSEAPAVEVSYRLEGGEHVICVRDNGVGFNMDYAEKLFGVFQRLHRAEDFEGTGIGLSIVKRIITRHSGRVWAESSPGKGAAFFFTLPS
ncbi:MAG: PAS domain S-box protein [Elusimicrobia bacterium]|nr:PAS domain S-box protein [Elusimicrobiota bacterium]